MGRWRIAELWHVELPELRFEHTLVSRLQQKVARVRILTTHLEQACDLGVEGFLIGDDGEVVRAEAKGVLKLSCGLIQSHVAQADEEAERGHERRRVDEGGDGHGNEDLKSEQEKREKLAKRVRKGRRRKLRRGRDGARGSQHLR